MATTTHDVSYVFIELGLVIVGLAVLARLASRWGFSAIPLYLLAGLAFGNGGLAPLRLSENFVRTGAEIGVLLLLFKLGLEYTGDELKKSLRLGVTAGVIDFLLTSPPGSSSHGDRSLLSCWAAAPIFSPPAGSRKWRLQSCGWGNLPQPHRLTRG